MLEDARAPYKATQSVQKKKPPQLLLEGDKPDVFGKKNRYVPSPMVFPE